MWKKFDAVLQQSLNDCFLLSARMLYLGENSPGSQFKSLYFRDWGQFEAHIHLHKVSPRKWNASRR
jgi:hypothetical protein